MRQMTFDEVVDMEYIGSEYEWAVVRTKDHPSDLHRGPMPRSEAVQWVKEWDDMQENRTGAVGMFSVVKRRVGEWEYAERS